LGIPFCSLSYRRNPKGRQSFPGNSTATAAGGALPARQNNQDKRLFIKDIMLWRKLVWSLPDCFAATRDLITDFEQGTDVNRTACYRR
jgi:hypothetical protein